MRGPLEPTRRGFDRRGPLWLGSAILLAALGTACGPIRDGPQVKEIPEGLGFTDAISSARLPLPDRPKVRQVGYIGSGESPDSIIITEYPGPASRADAERARDTYAERYKSEEYGPVEDLEIDGRTAWAWLETDRYEGNIWSKKLTAIVPYVDATYSVEFGAHDEKLRDEAYLRKVVASFFIARRGSTDAIVYLGSGLLLAAIVTFVWRLRSARDR